MTKRLTLESVEISRHVVRIVSRIDDLRFTTTYWYNDVDFHELISRYGQDLIDRVAFHIALFDINKVASLRPSEIDLGVYAKFHTVAFERIWRHVFEKVWAQWRYEHNLPHYHGPDFVSKPIDCGRPSPITIQSGSVEVLAFCGGGKDSLAAMRLLENAGVRYATQAYSHSVYGRAEMQHSLIAKLLDKCSPARRHQQHVYDDFLDCPVVEFYPEFKSKTLLAAETPASIFASLPVALQHGYTGLALAHERSANVGNLLWNVTGEEVNHQWGKSLEAEKLINDYIQKALIENVMYFSILQPINDVVIFYLLRDHLDAVPMTHSCNLKKPWCNRCAKCAYVWLNFMAYFPEALVERIFKENLFDVDENQVWFRQMLGLEKHTPFECIGQKEEVRLAFEICLQKGLKGRALEFYAGLKDAFNVDEILNEFVRVHEDCNTMPAVIAEGILPQMQVAAETARRWIRHQLQLGKAVTNEESGKPARVDVLTSEGR